MRKPCLDDAGYVVAGVAIRWRSWGDVPLMVLTHRPDVADQAAAVGARAGIRQRINLGKIINAMREVVGQA